jgi:CubicO group peptidase (beta-lactamase class C family)
MLQGQVHPAFQKTARVLERQLGAGGGAALCIYHRGEPVVDCWGGVRDVDGNPWERDTLSLSYSTTKGVASTLLHILVDRGFVDYDAPVAEYWPEFAQAGKAAITIRQLMCHEAGLYDIRGIVDHARRMLDWNYMTEALARAAPVHPPGAAHGYHGLTYGWLVGEIIQRVSGASFKEFLARELVEPLALDGMYIGLPEGAEGRCAKLLPSALTGGGAGSVDRMNVYLRRANNMLRTLRTRIDLDRLASALMPHGIEEVDFNEPDFLRAVIPAANGMFTARSLAKVYALLANDGELGGQRLIGRSTVWRASEVQNTSAGRVIPIPMHWRLGYHRVGTLGVRVPNGFGHFGFGGSGAWCDPDRGLAVALTLNSGIGTPFGDMRMVRIATAACRSADRRRD